MPPCVCFAIEDVVSGIGRVWFLARLFLDEELEGVAHFPIPKHVRVAAFALTAEAIVNRLGVGFRHLRMQFRRSIPNRKDRPAFLCTVVLNAAISASQPPGMPVRAAVINRGMRREHSNLAVDT